MWGSAVTGMCGLGRRWQGGGACVPGHLEENLPQTLALKAWAGFSLAACPCFSSCLCCLQTGSPQVSCQPPAKPPAGWRTVSSRETQAQALCPLQRCPKSGRNCPWSPRTGAGLGTGRLGGHPLGQQTQYGLFFLYGLGQILLLLWVSVTPSVQWN